MGELSPIPRNILMGFTKRLRQRRKNTQNIFKITKTMELVSTVKLKKALRYATNFKEYKERNLEILQKTAIEVLPHPLLHKHETVSRVLLFMIAGNRGLCGNYNMKIVDAALTMQEKLVAEGKEVDLHVAGTKAIAAMNFKKIAFAKKQDLLPDRPEFPNIDRLSTEFMEAFLSGSVQEVWILYTNKTTVVKELLLPMTLPLPLAHEEKEENYILFLPERERLLEALLPRSIKIKLYDAFLHAAVSEQTARMLAMKQASENAEKMIKELTKQYNRARQAQITREILEIMGGVEVK